MNGRTDIDYHLNGTMEFTSSYIPDDNIFSDRFLRCCCFNLGLKAQQL